jgi:hypothetical protein
LWINAGSVFVLLSKIDARHKNYNLADFLLPRNSYANKV